MLEIINVIVGIFDNNVNLKEDYMADDINAILEKVESYEDIIFVGNGAELHKDLISSKFPNAKFCDKNIQAAYSCGLIGLKKYKENNLENADTILPKYLRKSQAERLQKKDN